MTDDTTPLPGMIGAHPSMRTVFALVRRVAPTDLSVVIQGETGTGKELVARAIHDLSAVAGGPFVDINCAAIPDNLIEAELFGSERGAYSGSVKRTIGLLELADGGTLFLDEACSLLKIVQAKLLRAIEQHHFRRVGGRDVIRSRYRLVLAMSRQMDDLVTEGRYLAAFAHRVSGVEIHLPPLAQRGRDVSLLAQHLLAEVAAHVGRPMRWSEPALEQLQAMTWPGNVRELRALVSRLPLHAEAEIIEPADVLASGRRQSPATVSVATMRAAVERHEGNYSRAARDLGVPRTTLRERLLRPSI
jgi:two-component system NtrC family response regulator